MSTPLMRKMFLPNSYGYGQTYDIQPWVDEIGSSLLVT